MTPGEGRGGGGCCGPGVDLDALLLSLSPPVPYELVEAEDIDP